MRHRAANDAFRYGASVKFIKFLNVLALVTLSYGASAQGDDSLYVLALGDSLTAGYELDPDYAFPVRLEATLRDGGVDATVINAGVSGDTSSGGLTRLDWAVSDVPNGQPDLAIIELGANDALRGIEPSLTKQNLQAIIEYFQARDVTVLLVGMQAPPNMGPDYEAEFNGLYPALAEQYEVAFYPFFLDGVAANPDLNLSDGMHPNNEGVDVIVTRIAPLVKTLLETEPAP